MRGRDGSKSGYPSPVGDRPSGQSTLCAISCRVDVLVSVWTFPSLLHLHSPPVLGHASSALSNRLLGGCYLIFSAEPLKM